LNLRIYFGVKLVCPPLNSRAKKRSGRPVAQPDPDVIEKPLPLFS
jgi:hypothetical protein